MIETCGRCFQKSPQGLERWLRLRAVTALPEDLSPRTHAAIHTHNHLQAQQHALFSLTGTCSQHVSVAHTDTRAYITVEVSSSHSEEEPCWLLSRGQRPQQGVTAHACNQYRPYAPSKPTLHPADEKVKAEDDLADVCSRRTGPTRQLFTWNRQGTQSGGKSTS